MMQKSVLSILFALLTFLCLGQTQLKSNYQQFFKATYKSYNTLPEGVLEAVSYSKTRFKNINPATDLQSCTGMPLYVGVMGLIQDGKGYFKNTLKLVSTKSGISEANIISNQEMAILAYAKAFAKVQVEMGITSTQIEDNIAVLKYLSELPDSSNGQQFALDAEIYSILKLMNDADFMGSLGFLNSKTQLNKVFGLANFNVLSSSKISFSSQKIQGNNSSYQGKFQKLCLDYPTAIWTAADASNYSSRSGTAISAVTIHTVQGSYAGCISWFQNSSANVSAHYVLRSSDGQVTQMVCESDKAWHVGSANPYTIGLEHEGFVNDPAWYTVAMYTSSANVCKDIANSGYGIDQLRTAFWPWTAATNYNVSSIPGSCTRIKGHQHFPSQTHTDPGANWDWDYFFKLINDPPPTTTEVGCTGSFYDSGGSGANYGNDERSLTVIAPTNASSVTLTFSAFDLESTWDYLYIYDGNSVWAPLIGYYTGTNNPGTVTSSGSSLAVEFRSDCSANNAGWEATWTCTTTANTPNNLTTDASGCSNSNYSINLSWANADAGWWLDISLDPAFATYWNKPIDWLTTTPAPTGFQDPFSLGTLTLQPDSVYYWRIWDGTTWVNGPSFSIPFCPDMIAPTTSISNPNLWETMDFAGTFTDDDLGGSGMDTVFYQVLDFDGTEWRANNGNGFYNDNFDNAIHSEWTIATGTWAISGGYLNQSDEGLNQTNIYTSLTQTNTEIYLYHWQANTQSGVSSSRRQGLHFFCDNGALPNGGNGYFVYFRADNNKCQIYKVASDVWTIQLDTALVVNENTWYDYKILFDPATGSIKAYQDNIFVGEWIDSSPYTSGNSAFLRTGNADVLFNDFKVYRARTSTETISVGPAATNDVRFQNPNPSTPSCRIKSIVKDNAENWSALATLNVNIDWTPPSDVVVNDGLSADVDTVCSTTELSANWTASADPHSAVVRYWYAIGTTPGGTDIINWLDNGTNTSVTQTNLGLNTGTIYYVSVRVENGAGLFSNDISSDGQVPNSLTILASADTTQITLPDSIIVFTDSTIGAVQWLWSFPGGNPASSTNQVQSVVYDSSGIYDVSLTVTDAYGCTASYTANSYISVSVPPPAIPVAGFTSNVISGCGSLTVNFTDVSTNVPDDWLWDFPGGDTVASTDQNPTITYLNPGTYTVTLTASNFFGSNTVVMVNYIIVYADPIASVSPNQNICSGEDVTLTANGGTTYLWSTGATSDSITVSPTSTTTYTVTAFENGCSSQPVSVTVSVSNLPATTISADETICINDSTTLTATGGDNYTWSTGDTTASITVEATTIPATYMVVISSDACIDVDTQYVTITSAQQPIADFTATPLVTTLQNATINFANTSSSATQYFWSFGDGNTSTSINPTNTYADTGWYSVYLASNNDYCPGDTLVKTQYIHIMSNSPVANFTNNNDSVCIGDSIYFTNQSSDADTYLWLIPGGNPASSNLMSPAVKFDTSGTYEVTLISSGPGGADTSIQSINIVVAQSPIAAFGATDSTLILPNTTATFVNSSANADSYSWDFGDGNSATGTNPWNVYPTNVAVYTVTLIAESNVCPNDTLVVTDMISVETGVGVEKHNFGEVVIYPNPAENLLVVESSTNTLMFISIYDALGKLIYTKEKLEKKERINLSELSPGSYLVKLTTSTSIYAEKLIIIR